MKWSGAAGILIAGLMTMACGPSDDSLAGRGQRVYAGNCTACHNINPAVDGALGPAIAQTPRDVVEARVLGGTYPPGYKPKRDTGLMQPLPHLRDDIDALAAYLASVEAR